MSIGCKSNGILNVFYKVWPPANNVAVILLGAVTIAILPSDQNIARIRLLRNVLLVPPRASKNTIRTTLIFVYHGTKAIIHILLVCCKQRHIVLYICLLLTLVISIFSTILPCKPIIVYCLWLWQAILRQFPTYNGKYLILQVIKSQVKKAPLNYKSALPN